MKSFLPQLTAPAVAEIYPSRIEALHVAKKCSQSIFARRYDNKMPVFWHKALGPNFDWDHICSFSDELEVTVAVVAAGENTLPTISALGDVMRVAWHYESWRPYHCLTPFRKSVFLRCPV